MDGYLRDETGVDQDTLNLLRQEAVGSRDESQALPNIPRADLIDALETVRICDPAVGSGAFLLGAIQEIVSLRRGILFSKGRYVEPDMLYRSVSDWKRRTIENSLYGVDINPEAVEICRLRLWLSMVLDMDEPPESNSNWALPNLDFQIVAGDSLVDRVAGVIFKESWPTPNGLQLGMDLQRRLRQLENNIANRRREFEGTHKNPGRLRQLRDLIARDQREIVRLHLEDALKGAGSDLRALKRKKKPAKTAQKKAKDRIERIKSLIASLESTDFTLVQKPFLWPIAFPDVLREGDSNAGFDIVLANPPYLRQEKLDPEDQLSYGESFPEVHSGTADLLVYFYARALQILRPRGWLSFITSNSFTKRKYGANLRGYLPRVLTIDRVIDFGEVKIFDATVEPYVLIGHKTTPEPDKTLVGHNLYAPLNRSLGGRGNVERVREEIQNLPDHLEAEVSSFLQNRLTESEWRIENELVNLLFERLMNQGTPLGELVKGRIYFGIKTGLNEAFVINETKRQALLEEDPGSAELIKPWLRGRDIKRWCSESPGLYVIHIPWSLDLADYPAIEQHLLWSKDKLENRPEVKRGIHPWYAMSRWGAEFHSEFAVPKIILPDFARFLRFAYDEDGHYLANTCYFIPYASKYLLTQLNSSLFKFLLCQITNTPPGGFMKLHSVYTTRLPIVTPDKDVQAELEALANEILRIEDSPERVEAIEREIDSIVFHVYGLSAPERKLVLDWLNERSVAPNGDADEEHSKLNFLRATTGAWRRNVDTDQLIRDIRASRDIHTRPVPRL